jgi:hypothetical protein
MELKIAAKVDAVDEEYFETEIRHLLNDPLVDFVGNRRWREGGFPGRSGGLAHAHQLAGAVRTGRNRSDGVRHPLIAFPFGSMPELIEPGVNGTLVESVDQAIAAVEALAALDRTLCRRSFEERFTTTRMARDYVGVYKKALAEEAVSSPSRAALPAAGIPIAVPALVAEEAAASRLAQQQALAETKTDQDGGQQPPDLLAEARDMGQGRR